MQRNRTDWGRSRSASGPSPTPSVGRTLRAALDAVARAETAALATSVAPAVTFHHARRVAWRDDVDLPALRRLADPSLHELPPSLGTVAVPCRSSLIRLGPASRPDHTRVRSYLQTTDQLRTLKVWVVGGGRRKAGRRERMVRRTIAAYGAYPAPAVLAEGVEYGVHFILEPVILGRHPSTAQERLAAAVAIGHDLAAGYRASGISDRRLRDLVRPTFAEGLEAVLDDPGLPWPPGRHAAMTAGLRSLVERDLSLPCALGHGDLNTGNVIRDERGRHWLIDWETAGDIPIAFDLRKLLLSSHAPDVAQQRLAADLSGFNGDGVRRYRWPEQLALAMANELALTSVRRRRAAAAGLEDHFDAVLRRRLAWLADTLEA